MARVPRSMNIIQEPRQHTYYVLAGNSSRQHSRAIRTTWTRCRSGSMRLSWFASMSHRVVDGSPCETETEVAAMWGNYVGPSRAMPSRGLADGCRRSGGVGQRCVGPCPL